MKNMKNRNMCLNDGCMWLTDGVLCCRSCEHARRYMMQPYLDPLLFQPEGREGWKRWFGRCWNGLREFYLGKEVLDGAE